MLRAARLWYRERKLRRLYEPLMKAAKGAERERIENEWSGEHRAIFEARLAMRQGRLLREAGRFLIPTPPSENWEESRVTISGRFLTPKAAYELHEQIQRAKKARQEVRLGWIPLVTALSGLIGTTTGLLAILLR